VAIFIFIAKISIKMRVKNPGLAAHLAFAGIDHLLTL
jgi:hypothetical protein